jgi:hypothetical protein
MHPLLCRPWTSSGHIGGFNRYFSIEEVGLLGVSHIEGVGLIGVYHIEECIHYCVVLGLPLLYIYSGGAERAVVLYWIILLYYIIYYIILDYIGYI